jgi:hypothetical protein
MDSHLRGNDEQLDKNPHLKFDKLMEVKIEISTKEELVLNK